MYFAIISFKIYYKYLSNGKKIRYWELRNSWGTYSGDGGYCYMAFSTDVPQNSIIEIDIPRQYYTDPKTGEIQWSGGIFTLSPGPMPIQTDTSVNIYQPQTDLILSTDNLIGNDNGSNINILGLKISVFAIIFLLLFVIILIFIINK